MRDEAIRALIEKWRDLATRRLNAADLMREGVARSQTKILAVEREACADELEAAALSQETPAPPEFRAFAKRLWYRWQAEKLDTGSDSSAYWDAVDNELKDMRPRRSPRAT